MLLILINLAEPIVYSLELDVVFHSSLCQTVQGVV
jgi:hypothetical protein